MAAGCMTASRAPCWYVFNWCAFSEVLPAAHRFAVGAHAHWVDALGDGKLLATECAQPPLNLFFFSLRELGLYALHLAGNFWQRNLIFCWPALHRRHGHAWQEPFGAPLLFCQQRLGAIGISLGDEHNTRAAHRPEN